MLSKVTPDNAKKHLDAAVNCCERELIELDADHNSMAGVPWAFLVRLHARGEDMANEKEDDFR